MAGSATDAPVAARVQQPPSVLLTHRRRTESELFNSEYRAALIAILIPGAGSGGGGLPVVPLIEIVLSYSFPFCGVVSTAAGAASVAGFENGAATRDARFRFPKALCLYTHAPSGVKSILIADTQNHCYRRLTDFESGAGGVVSTLCGDGHSISRLSRPLSSLMPLSVQFPHTTGLCVDPLRPSDRIYLCDLRSVRCLKLSPETGRPLAVSVIAGGSISGYSNGVGRDAQFAGLSSIACTSDGATLLVADASNNRVRSIAIASGAVTTVAGTGAYASRVNASALTCSFTEPRAIAFDRHPSLAAAPAAAVAAAAAAAAATPVAASTATTTPALASSVGDSVLYIATGNQLLQLHRDWKYVSVVENDLPVSCIPAGLTTLSNGLIIFSCSHSHSIYSVDPLTGKSERLAGGGPDGVGTAVYLSWTNDGRGSADGLALVDAQFMYPAGLCVDEPANALYVADSSNSTIRRVALPPHVCAPLVPVPAGTEYRAVRHTDRLLPPPPRETDDTRGFDPTFTREVVVDGDGGAANVNGDVFADFVFQSSNSH